MASYWAQEEDHDVEPKAFPRDPVGRADGGASWTDVSGNLPDVPVNDVMLVGSKIVVATDLGVVVSANGGATWSRLGSNLPYTTALDITLGPDGKLYAATHGRGIWSIPQP
jgi:hypothetical protein